MDELLRAIVNNPVVQISVSLFLLGCMVKLTLDFPKQVEERRKQLLARKGRNRDIQ